MKTLLLTLLLALLTPDYRNLQVCGVVTNSDNFKPLAGVQIKDDKQKVIATTDHQGYFSASIPLAKSGEIHFNLHLKAEGYMELSLREHWGDLGTDLNAAYFIGMQKGNVPPFSELFMDKKITSPTQLSKDMSMVKEKLLVERDIQAMKEGNEHVFLAKNNKYYLVNQGGYLELASDEDLISIDKTRTLPAKELNAVLKRSQVKGMSTLNDEKVKVVLFTH